VLLDGDNVYDGKLLDVALALALCLGVDFFVF
jgi:hypothetical protein